VRCPFAACRWSPQFRSVAKGMGGEFDQAVVLLLSERGSHVEHVVEYSLDIVHRRLAPAPELTSAGLRLPQPRPYSWKWSYSAI
jgi:hypothetical protein